MVGLAHLRPSPSSFSFEGVRLAGRRSSKNPGRTVQAPPTPSELQGLREMSGQNEPNIGRIDTQACPDRAVAFIRSRYPTKTAECVAADLGMPAHTVRRWLEGAAKPSWDAVWALLCAYGPDFAVSVLPRPPKWMSDAHQRERLSGLEAEQARINAELSALRAQL